MPLIKGKSKQAFSKNVETEMNSGKSQKQSLAIAYSMKRKAKKMAMGGDPTDSGADYNPKAPPPPPDPKKVKSMGFGIFKADGGEVEDKSSPLDDVGEKIGNFVAGNGYKSNDEYLNSPVMQAARASKMAEGGAVMEDDRMLNQHGEIEEGPQGRGEGFHDESYMGHQHDPHDEYSETEDGDGTELVGRIMKQRQQMYSEGGRVANSDKPMADGMKAEYDDLHLRDDLESSYTGENSGDELGDAQEDKDRADIVSRIMKSRAKKDRLPNPR